MCVIRPLNVKREAKIILLSLLLLLLLLLLLILLETTSFLGPKGLIKKYRGVGRRRLGLGAVSVFSSHTLVILNSRSLYFVCRGVSVRWYRYMDDLETSFGMVLDHYIRSVHWQPSIRMYLQIPSKGCKLLHFQWPSQACVTLLRYFDSVMLTLRLMDLCSCKFGTSRYNMIYSFFMSSCLLHILRRGLVTPTSSYLWFWFGDVVCCKPSR